MLCFVIWEILQINVQFVAPTKSNKRAFHERKSYEFLSNEHFPTKTIFFLLKPRFFKIENISID